MKKDKRAKRAKLKKKQANVNKQKLTEANGQSFNQTTHLDIPNSSQMKVGVQDENQKIVETIDTDGLSEFMSVIGEYQDKGFIDIYEKRDTPIDGYDAMFIPFE